MKLNTTTTAAAALLLLTTAHAATFTVINTNDSGAGSLRQAVLDNNATAGGNTIVFSNVVTGTIKLSSGELFINKNVTILGPGAATLAVDGNFPTTSNRVFNINTTSSTVSGLTITNGHPAGVAFGGAIYNTHSTLTLSNCILTGNAAYSGGGIFNNGEGGSATLTLNNCTLSGNSATGVGGGIWSPGTSGGSATLIIIASTISGNSAGNGGGIYSDGSSGGSVTGMVTASTFSGNSAFEGGGIESFAFNGNAVLTVSASTFSDNTATNGGGIASYTSTGDGTLTLRASTFSGNSASIGGGIFNTSTTLLIGDTILKAGGSGANITNSSGTVTSDGYNLCSDDGSGVLTNTTDQLNTDPLLGALANNGGPTMTHALLPGSPAIDKGKTFGLTTDQRGQPRPLDDPCLANVSGGDGSDIGAFETQEICADFRITAIVREADNIRITWRTFAGNTNALERTAGVAGNFATNGFTSITNIITTGTATNFLDNGAATNMPSRYYRVRLVP